MPIFLKSCRYFLIAILTFATVNMHNLSAMNSQQELSFDIVGQVCQHLADNVNPESGFTYKNIAYNIYSIYFADRGEYFPITMLKGTLALDRYVANHVSNIVANLKNDYPYGLAYAIKQICAWEPDLSQLSEVLGNALKKALQKRKINLSSFRNNDNCTLLYYVIEWAVNEGNLDAFNVVLTVAKSLDQAWELIVVREASGWHATALHRAVGNLEIVKSLLAQAPTNQDAWKLLSIRTNFNWGEYETALHLAVRKNAKEVIKLLLETAQKVDKAREFINMQDRRGNTAWGLAQDDEVLEILQEYL